MVKLSTINLQDLENLVMLKDNMQFNVQAMVFIN